MSESHPELLAKQQSSDDGPCIIGDVRIHPTANVDRSATVSVCVAVGAMNKSFHELYARAVMDCVVLILYTSNNQDWPHTHA